MTLKEFAKMLDGRECGCEITKEEEAIAKELGFVIVFGASDDLAELRGAINDEIGCYDGGVLEHEELPREIYADWCPKDVECSWAYGTSIPHEKFNIYEDGDLYCVGIVCDINEPKQTNGDRIRAMIATDDGLADIIFKYNIDDCIKFCAELPECFEAIEAGEFDPYGISCRKCLLNWLKQPAED